MGGERCGVDEGRALRAEVRGSLPAYLPTCLPVYLPACLPACLLARLPVCLAACLRVCLPALCASLSGLPMLLFAYIACIATSLLMNCTVGARRGGAPRPSVRRRHWCGQCTALCTRCGQQWSEGVALLGDGGETIAGRGQRHAAASPQHGGAQERAIVQHGTAQCATGRSGRC